LATNKSLPKLPISRDNVVAGDGAAIASSDFEGERLAVEVGVALPVLAPVS